MSFSSLENVLWVTGFAGQILLLMCLLLRQRWRQFPIFTGFIFFDIVRDIALFWAFQHGSPHAYAVVYWTAFGVDIILQIAIVFEIARIVLRPTGSWMRDARSTFFIIGLIGALVALGLTYVVHPSSSTSLASWEIRAYLFTSMLFCELFLAMMFAANRLGLVWRNHVMGLGQGLAIWALVGMALDITHSYFGANHQFNTLESVRSITYQVAVIYWMVTFWLEEPERRPLSPEMQKYLVALHSKVQYDATQVSSMQNFH
jgi:hypothetical protein